MDTVRTSKFLSLVLRHKPEAAGIALDENGWVNVDELLSGCKKHGHPLTLEQLLEVVETNDKKRFALNENGTKIRASQGHSVEVDLKLEAKMPPTVLYHGTATRFMGLIEKEGLKKMTRQHVHLSATQETAQKVGARHGKPIIYTVDAAKMHQDGFTFFLSENGVWLVDSVPMEYLKYV
jgi:putative RNA 2'-phosphotransferase